MATRRDFLKTATAAALAAPFVARPALASPQRMKFGNVLSANHHINLTAVRLAEEVKARTNGAIEIQVFPSGQLGQEREMFESMQLGSLQLGCIAGNAIEVFEPSEGLFSLPYLFATDEQAFKLQDGPIGQEIANRVLAKTGIRYLTYGHIGLRSTLTRTKQIRTAADFEGLKIRVPPSPSFVSAFKLLGASPTAIPAGELYTALQMGVVDGIEGTAYTLNDFKAFEIAKNLTMTRHIYTDSPFLMSDKVWQRLPKEHQEAFMEGARVAEAEERVKAAELEKAVLDGAGANGVTVIDIDITPMRERMKPYYEEFSRKIGGSELVDAAIAAINA